jgi:hypothetical protein
MTVIEKYLEVEEKVYDVKDLAIIDILAMDI